MTSSNGTNVSSVHIFKVFQNITTRFLIFLRSTLYSLRKLQNVDYKAIPIVTMRNVYIIYFISLYLYIIYNMYTYNVVTILNIWNEYYISISKQTINGFWNRPWFLTGKKCTNSTWRFPSEKQLELLQWHVRARPSAPTWAPPKLT